MKVVEYYIRINQKPFVLAAVQWFLTTILQIDRLFFTYEYETKHFLAVKILYFIFLLVAWSFGFTIHKRIKEGNKEYCRGFEIFSVYFIIMMVLLLIVWPGTWMWDDLWVLRGISTYDSWYPWQNIITGAYQDVLLQILPFPGGIILLQNIIISLCVAFGVTRLEAMFDIKRLKNRFVDILVKILPFLLPPVLLYQFSGYRMGLYVYLEFVMLVILIGAFRDKTEWSISYLCLFCFLCVIVSVWRTESMFYIPIACFLVLFVKRNIISDKRKIICIIFLVVGFVGISRIQKMALGDNNYEVISLLGPCVELVKIADEVEDADLLSDIDKVMKLETIRNIPTSNGSGLYWTTDVMQTGYTDKDYSAFLHAIVKLSLKYPRVVITERWNLFVRASGITGDTYTTVGYGAALFEPNNESAIAQIILDKGWIANKPVLKNMRRISINLLGLKKADGSGNLALYRIVYNVIIPLLTLLFAGINELVRKKWYLWGICTAILIKLPIVILTQPEPWIMYFLSFYLLGYVYFVYSVLIFWSRKTKSDIKQK